MASFIQLVTLHPDIPADWKAYSVYPCDVQDYPFKPWRELKIDIARHYVPFDNILTEVDGMALAKFNVLKLVISQTEQFDIKFQNQPQSKFINAAYTKYYYYTMQELAEIQKYCHKRGIFLAFEIAFPSHVYSWKKVDSSYVANCPNVESSNKNGVLINPLNDEMPDAIVGVAVELS